LTTYLIRRFVQGFVVLALSTFVIYAMLMLTPGGPQDQINDLRLNNPRGLNSKLIEYLEHLYKLDRPWPLNYAAWLFDPQSRHPNVDVAILGQHIVGSGVLTGDFSQSVSIAKGVPVAQMIGERMGNTVALTGSALLISILLAFPIGIIAAIRQYSRLDYAVTAFSFVGLAMPGFWLGLILIIFLAVIPKQLHIAGATWLPFLPPGNISDPGQDSSLVNHVYHLILPVTVLGFIQVAGLSRFVRASMLEVLRQDYVRTAWAKGLTQRMVILKHALRNALIPVITVITLSLPGLLAGAIITETVFNYAGLGQLYYNAVVQLDIPLVMGFLFVITATIILSNMLADVLYAMADPRIRYS
jgi:peptide/nickel transport system permease protein